MQKVFTLAPDYAAGRQMIDALRASFTAAGGEVVGQEFTPFQKTQDFGPYLAQAKASGADAVYVFYAGGEAISFVKQYDSFGLKAELPLYGSGFLTSPLYVERRRPGGRRCDHRAALRADHRQSEPTRPFAEAFTAATGRVPSEYAVQGYDAARALIEATKTGATDRADARRRAAQGQLRRPARRRFRSTLRPTTSSSRSMSTRPCAGEDGLTQKVLAQLPAERIPSNGCEMAPLSTDPARPADRGGAAGPPIGGGPLMTHDLGFWTLQTLNALQLSMLLFLLSIGLTVIFGLMHFVNLAHGSLYALGAYFARLAGGGRRLLGRASSWRPSRWPGWVSCSIPGLIRRMRKSGPMAQVLVTFGLIFALLDLTRIFWGDLALAIEAPALLEGRVALLGVEYPTYRLFVIALGLAIFGALAFVLSRTQIGAMIRAGVDNDAMAACLGINVERLFFTVFCVGCALAGLAGAVAAPLAERDARHGAANPDPDADRHRDRRAWARSRAPSPGR